MRAKKLFIIELPTSVRFYVKAENTRVAKRYIQRFYNIKNSFSDMKVISKEELVV